MTDLQYVVLQQMTANCFANIYHVNNLKLQQVFLLQRYCPNGRHGQNASRPGKHLTWEDFTLHSAARVPHWSWVYFALIDKNQGGCPNGFLDGAMIAKADRISWAFNLRRPFLALSGSGDLVSGEVHVFHRTRFLKLLFSEGCGRGWGEGWCVCCGSGGEGRGGWTNNVDDNTFLEDSGTWTG